MRGQVCDHVPPTDFRHVVNRLKVVANLWPARYPQAVDGVVEMRVSGEAYEVGVRFLDMGECPSCTLSIRPARGEGGGNGTRNTEGGMRRTANGRWAAAGEL